MTKFTLNELKNTYPDFPKYPLYLTVFGSHLWGTNIATSDIDVRGVCLEPIPALIGLGGFDQFERLEPKDITVWGLRKFFHLAIGNNPNILCVLFSPYRDGRFAVYTSYTWERIMEYRDLFLCKDKIVDNFIGYAYGQYQKANKHVQWIKKPPVKPNPYDFGYVDNEGWINADYKKKVQFDALNKEHENYIKWVATRNQKRHATELQYGIDTKNLYNMIMLLQLGEELLQTGQMTFPRPNASELLAIRNGAMSYEDAGKYMDSKKLDLERLRETSEVRNKPNTNVLEELMIETLYSHIKYTKENFDY